MNSLRHVFWRGAMALGFLTLGLGSGLGFPEVPVRADQGAVSCKARSLQARESGVARVEIDAARDIAAQLRANGPARGG